MLHLKRKATEDFWVSRMKEMTSSPFLRKYDLDTQGRSGNFSLRIPDELVAEIKLKSRGDKNNMFALYAFITRVMFYKYDGVDNGVLVTSGFQNAEDDNLLFIHAPISNEKQVRTLIKAFLQEVQLVYKKDDFSFEDALERIDGTSQKKADIFSNPGFFIKGINCESALLEELPLLFEIDIADNSHQLIIRYVTDAFDKGLIEQFSQSFCKVAAFVLANPEGVLQDLSLITYQQFDDFFSQYRQDTKVFPGDYTHVWDLIKTQVRQNPDKIAVKYNDLNLSYQQIDNHSSQFSNYLNGAHDIEKGDVVGVMLQRTPECIKVILGLLRRGITYVPIDPECPVERADFILHDCGVRAVICDSSCEAVLDKITDRKFQLINIVDKEADISSYSSEPLDAEIDVEATAYIIYTSGSTGVPKGVKISHRALLNLAESCVHFFNVEQSRTQLQFAPLSFDASIAEIFPTLIVGASLVIIDKEVINDTNLFLDYVNEQNVDQLILPPSYLTVLDFNRLKSVKTLITAGEEAIPKDAMNCSEFLDYFNAYGPTEFAVCASGYHVTAADTEKTTIPVGLPMLHTEILILDESQQLVPVGVEGEIYLAGKSLSSGYVNRPELNAKIFIDHPWKKGSKLYRTGDIGRFDFLGNLIFVGRRDSQIKLRGHRIELSEIESVMRQHASVNNCLVLVHEKGTTRSLLAYYTSHAGEDTAELGSFLKEKLPPYMVPSQYVLLESFPLTANGKIDKSALPDPEEDRSSVVAPANEQESILVSAFTSVLGLEEMSVLTNFFEIGGDSIKAIQVSSKLNTLGYKLEVRSIFQYPTIRQLSEHLETSESVSDQSAVTGKIDLTPIQQMFFNELAGDQPHHFNQSIFLKLPNTLSKSTVEEVITRLQDHHDALRMRYEFGQEITQFNAGLDYPVAVTAYDYRGLSVSEEALLTLVNGLQSGINLSEGPMLHAGLFHFDDGDRLLLIIHHLVVDGVSWRILMEDLWVLLDAVQRGVTASLPPKSSSYQQWSSALGDYVSSPSFSIGRTYWMNAYQEFEGTGRISAPSTEKLYASDYEEQTITLSQEKTRLLLHDSYRAFRLETTDMLLSALGVAISDHWEIDSLLLSVESHGRADLFKELDITRTVGWFTSVYPYLLQAPGTKDWSDYLRLVKDSLKAIPNNGIDHGLLQYATSETTKELPSPQLSFNYLGQTDSDLSKTGFDWAREPSGNNQSGSAVRTHEIDLVCLVRSGELSIQVSYHKHRHSSKQMQEFLMVYKRSLEDLIGYCTSYAGTLLSLGDLSYSGLSLKQLDHLQEVYPLEDAYPLSPMQEGMMFHHMYDEGGSAYFEQVSYKLKGALDLEQVSGSLAHLFESYDILRTCFIHEGQSIPLQLVRHDCQGSFTHEDLQELSSSEQQARMAKFRSADRERGFDISKDVLLRLHIFTLSSDTYEFVWSYSHMLMDGWCITVLNKRFFSHYLGNPETGNVPSYKEYINWLSAQDRAATAAYWDEELSGYEGLSSLPAGFRKTGIAADSAYESGRYELRLTATETSQLEALCTRHQLTMSTVIQGLWGIMLGKYNNSRDTVFGTVVSGRNAEVKHIDQMVGLFINTIPVRVRQGEGSTVLSVLEAQQASFASSSTHHHFPLSEINSTRGGGPLFDHILIFENYPASDTLERLPFEVSEIEVFEQTNYDFNLIILPGESLKFVFNYNRQVFNESSIGKIGAHFQWLINQFISTPEVAIEEVRLLSPEAEQEIIDAGRGEVKARPDTDIVRLFERQVEISGSDVALLFEGATMSYEALNRRSNQLAHHLRRTYAITPNDRIGLLAERGMEMIVGIFGILKSGAGYVPIDPGYPEKRIAYMSSDAGIKLMITSGDVSAAASSYEGTVLDLPASSELLTTEPEENPEKITKPSDLAYIIYTSGSTGTPKGVMVAHENVLNLVSESNYFDVKKEDKVLQMSNFAFDGSVYDIFGALLNGAELQLISKDDLLSNQKLYQLIKENGINNAFFTTALLNNLIELSPDCLSNFDKLYFGGERVSVAHILKALPFRKQEDSLVHVYGPTECTTFSTFHVIDRLSAEDETIPIGRPISNVNIFIADQDGHPLPYGVDGEVWISGGGVARGYLLPAGVTNDKFVISPYEQGEIYYRTGDIGRFDFSGNLIFVGRRDSQIKLRGHRIELSEIESVMRQHASVNNCLVLVYEKGTTRSLLAYYTSHAGEDNAELGSFLKEKLPPYMVPSQYVLLESFPLTANGKIDKSALPDPEEDRSSVVAPANEQESILVSAFTSVLGLEEISVLTNFFEIGGDSIKAIQVSSKLNTLGYKLEVRSIFQYPTIRQLSEHLETSESVSDQSAVTGKIDLTPIQQMFFNELAGDQPHHFNQSIFLKLPNTLSKSTVEEVIIRLQEHHDALRMRYEFGQEITQFNAGLDYPVAVTAYDYRGLSVSEEALLTLVNDLQSGINLSEGPMLHAGLFHFEDGDRLLLIIHHLVVDGVSWRILMKDLWVLLDAVQRGVTASLPPKSSSYQQWSSALGDYVSSPAFSIGRTYWMNAYQEFEGTGRISAPSTEKLYASDYEEQTITLSQEKTRLLLHDSYRAFRLETTDMLLSALGVAISDHWEIDSLLLSVESHGRADLFKELDITRTVGWFTSVYPYLLQAPGTKDWSDYLRLVKDSLKAIPNNGIDHGLLQYATSETTKELPSPQLSFNYLGQTDSDLSKTGFDWAREPSGNNQSGSAVRTHEIDLVCLVRSGELSIQVSYHKHRHSSKEMQEFLMVYKRSLEDLIGYCTSYAGTLLSPGDLSYSGLSLKQLDHLQEVYPLEDAYPLSPMQEGMMFHHMYDEGGSAYFEQVSYKLKGALDLEQVSGSLAHLFESYDILRTCFIHEGQAIPLQLVRHECQVSFTHEDLQELSSSEQQARMTKFRSADRERGFDISKDVLLRLHIFTLSADTYEFVWSYSHMLMDGWCITVLNKRFFSHYLGNPETGSVPSYKEYINWLSAQDRAATAAYWDEELSGYEGLSSLPAGFRKTGIAAGSAYESGRYELRLTATETSQLEALCTRHQLTMSTVIQGLWGILLGKYNNSRDTVFGTVVSGRNAEVKHIDQMVGLFINTIPVRVRQGEGSTVLSVLEAQQASFASSSAHHHFPLSEINSTRGGGPLFDHILIFENYPVSDTLERLPFEVSEIEVFEQTNYDFNLIILPGESLKFVFNYNRQVFNESSIGKIGAHFQWLINQFISTPEVAIEEVRLLSPEAERKIIDAGRGEVMARPDIDIVRLFERQVEISGSDVALLFEGATMSYEALNRRSNQLAHHLRRTYAITPNDRIGLLAERGMEMIVGIFGILKSGAGYVPIDPGYPEKRIAYMSSDAGIKLMITSGGVSAAASSYEGTVLDLPASSELLTTEPEENPEKITKPTDLAYIIYTSGSTGTPKGVMIAHENVSGLMDAKEAAFDFGRKDTWTLFHSICFDFSVWELFGSLLSGSRLVLLTKQNVQDTYEYLNILKEAKVTILNQVPSSFSNLLQVLEGEGDFSGLSVRYVIFGGEALKPGILEKWNNSYPDCQLINMYGITETTVHVSIHHIQQKDIGKGSSNIGQGLPGLGLYVMNESLQLQDAGIVGELFVSGFGLARGYVNDAQLTSEKFFEHPTHKGLKIYQTGDLGYYDEGGNVIYVGRKDKQLKVRGFRIELGEVEFYLNKFSAISEAVVAPVSESSRADDTMLVAFYKEQEPFEEQVLRQYMNTCIPGYMLPSVYVSIEQFPVTNNGKIDKPALVDLFRQEKPFGVYTREDVAPRDHVEKRIAIIWKKVLNVEVNSIKSNFFEIGGHSLKATRVASYLLEEFQIRLSLKNIFANPTIELLAKQIRGQDKENVLGIEPLPEQPYYDTSYAQKRLWFLSNLDHTRLNFNLLGLFRLKLAPDTNALEKALNAIIHRHEVLRTNFVFWEGNLKQTIANPEERLLHVELIEEESVASISTDYNKPFDLERDSLLDVRVFKVVDDYYMLFNSHHIVLDGWSMGLLFAELMDIYHRVVDKQPVELRDLPIQYKDFAHWQNRMLDTGFFDNQKKYWLDRFSKIPEPLRLPKDANLVDLQRSKGENIRVVFTEEESSVIYKIARENEVSLFIVLLATIKLLFNKYTAQLDIVLGTMVAGRTNFELEDQLGLYINTLAIRTSIDEQHTFRQYLEAVKSASLDAFENQDYPYDLIIQEIRNQQDDDQLSLFDVLVVLQNYGLRSNADEIDHHSYRIDEKSKRETTNFDLSYYFYEIGGGLELDIEYNGSIYDHSRIELMSRQLKNLLQEIHELIDTRIAEINLESGVSDTTNDLLDLNFKF